jgi:CIC family chloride channel protein
MSSFAPPTHQRRELADEEGRDQRVDITLSLVIGALVGLVVVAFILLTGRLAARMYPPESAAIRRVLIPVVGALLTGYLLYKYFPEARGSGIPQAKFALFIRDGYISLRTVLGKFICCSASLASGIALGREGPSVQIGAGIASVLARRFNLRPERVRALVPVGCAAALAAAFNTPIAAVLFSLEEILGDLHAPVLGSVVLSSATSWMTLHLILGDEPLFHVPAYQLVNPTEFLIYVVLGLVGGLGSVLFVKMLLNARLWFRSLPPHTAWIHPAAGGLIVGLLGWFLPEVLGVGYDYVERVLGGDMAVKTIAVLAIAKIVATSMSYASGNAGGIFGPSLFIGAMIGGTVGSIAHQLFPAWTANPGAYALVGMGCAFAGIVRTPLTSVIMIFEMTRDYSVIVPLMIANLISFVVSYRLQREPIYDALAQQEGVQLPGAEAREHISRTQVVEVSLATSIQEAAQLLDKNRVNALPVVDGQHVMGILTASQVKKALTNAHATVRSALTDSTPYSFVYPDQPLSIALERMGAVGLEAVPVVSRADARHYLGTVTLSDALGAYGLAAQGGRTRG